MEEFSDHRGRGSFVEADIFLRGTDEDPAVRSRHQIAFAPEDYPAQQIAARLQQSYLTSNGNDARRPAERFEQRIRP